MKTQKQNIILDSINYLKIFLPIHKEYDTYKHIGQAISDPFKVSYISEGKIKGISENTGVTIGNRPTDEQRNKYFTATSIEKLLKKLFVVNTSDESKKMFEVVNNIDDYLKQNLEYKYFVDSDVSGFYSNEPENYNGSCMAGKPKSYFEIYDYINDTHKTEHAQHLNNVKVKIVGFKSKNLILARALLWCKTYKNDKDNTTKKEYFLDRIYIHNKLQNSGFSLLQFNLYQTIRKYYRVHKLRAFNKSQIDGYIIRKYDFMKTEKFIFRCQSSHPSFSIDINGYGAVIDCFPYMDTFKYIDDNDTLNIDDCDTVKILDSTSGSYTDAQQSCCDGCDDSFDDDDLRYSDLDSENLCEDCREYIDERDEYVNANNAIYNNYSGHFHYADDIQ